MSGGQQMSVTLRTKNKRLAEAAIELLKAERPMTLRQLYYRLISAGELHNRQTEYQRLGSLMTRLREFGSVSRTWIVDHTRNRLKPSSWSGLGDFGESVRACYRKDFWSSLPAHVEIFVEKDAIAGTLQKVTDKYDVALQVCRGYSSVSFAGEIADYWSRIEKPIFAYYLGDFDPSGFDIERDLREKLKRYSGRSITPDSQVNADYNPVCAVFDEFFDNSVKWARLAICEADFDLHDLIRLPVKQADKRASGFVDRYGDYCAEVDALPPTELRRRVEQAIISHIDADRWEKLRTVEAAEQETLEMIVGKWAESKSELD